ncbi:uncharacterized protein EV422DRAFT_580161 [Fimicolochytrium jonesii]|uniref:uncharacterized protein n=1 Tax=Fimicolochytrium jonesii TaxID=1396493 RepID=UPI0022FEEF62|nr:uncharacterized protein EV422DRAFT_580161 [Fimicolochytrium jonesii]KAI8818437.1 hypothetical protein EV422DRAFT_580161 [Fimicolochytrium jonesii]
MSKATGTPEMCSLASFENVDFGGHALRFSRPNQNVSAEGEKQKFPGRAPGTNRHNGPLCPVKLGVIPDGRPALGGGKQYTSNDTVFSILQPLVVTSLLVADLCASFVALPCLAFGAPDTLQGLRPALLTTSAQKYKAFFPQRSNMAFKFSWLALAAFPLLVLGQTPLPPAATTLSTAVPPAAPVPAFPEGGPCSDNTQCSVSPGTVCVTLPGQTLGTCRRDATPTGSSSGITTVFPVRTQSSPRPTATAIPCTSTAPAAAILAICGAGNACVNGFCQLTPEERVTRASGGLSTALIVMIVAAAVLGSAALGLVTCFCMNICCFAHRSKHRKENKTRTAAAAGKAQVLDAEDDGFGDRHRSSAHFSRHPSLSSQFNNRSFNKLEREQQRLDFSRAPSHFGTINTSGVALVPEHHFTPNSTQAYRQSYFSHIDRHSPFDPSHNPSASEHSPALENFPPNAAYSHQAHTHQPSALAFPAAAHHPHHHNSASVPYAAVALAPAADLYHYPQPPPPTTQTDIYPSPPEHCEFGYWDAQRRFHQGFQEADGTVHRGYWDEEGNFWNLSLPRNHPDGSVGDDARDLQSGTESHTMATSTTSDYPYVLNYIPSVIFAGVIPTLFLKYLYRPLCPPYVVLLSRPHGPASLSRTCWSYPSLSALLQIPCFLALFVDASEAPETRSPSYSNPCCPQLILIKNLRPAGQRYDLAVINGKLAIESEAPKVVGHPGQPHLLFPFSLRPNLASNPVRAAISDPSGKCIRRPLTNQPRMQRDAIVALSILVAPVETADGCLALIHCKLSEPSFDVFERGFERLEFGLPFFAGGTDYALDVGEQVCAGLRDSPSWRATLGVRDSA